MLEVIWELIRKLLKSLFGKRGARNVKLATGKQEKQKCEPGNSISSSKKNIDIPRPEHETLKLSCGDSHSLWIQHNKGDKEKDFIKLDKYLLNKGSSVYLEVSVNNGKTWEKWALNRVSEGQISWKAKYVEGSRLNRVPFFVRIPGK